jgi:glycine dehydrogenase subunit 1
MRYIPHTQEEIKQMLEVIGVKNIDDLFGSIPLNCRAEAQPDLPPALSEPELMKHMTGIALKNNVCATSFLGGGAYRHYVPAAVIELAGRSEFVTPYTPYQPEVSQGTLQALFEYQTMISRIFAMDVTNASTYDGATSLAEACLMAGRIGKKRNKICICDSVHPEYRQVVQTTLRSTDLHIVEIPHEKGKLHRGRLTEALDDQVTAVVVGYPNFFGIVEDFKALADEVHGAGALLIVCVPEPLALGLFEAPGNFGADIVVGEGISFGLPVSFGGPTLGLFSTRQKFVRQMPGRICGRTTDANGRTGYVLTLSTREQHIRREKATSNICSNQALCATSCAIYLSLLGKEGFTKLARLNAAKAEYAKKKLAEVSGVKLAFDASTFNEFVIELPKPPGEVIETLKNDMIYGGIDLGRWYDGMEKNLLVCITEMNTKEEIDELAKRIGT